ncbi:MAG: heavy metal translocating P-type ATPase [Desulfovibrionaceae bacterium]
MIRQYRIHNLHCAGCAARIEHELTLLPGVHYAAIDLSTHRLRLEGDFFDLDTLNRIAAAIEPGTHLEVWRDNPEASPAEGNPHTLPLLAGMGLSALLLICGLLFAAGLAERYSPVFVNLVFFGLPYALCGYTVLTKGWQSLMRGDFFNEFTLMGGATLAAIAIGQLPEAVGVMLFYSIGEYVQERAAGNSRHSIRALLASRPTVAHRLDGENCTDCRPEDLGIGMHCLVKPGEKIPLDGDVLAGNSQVDTSPLTGEPKPVAVHEGSKVFAGTINLDGALTVLVTAVYEHSSVARILDMVESATARKAPTERFITRFARYYTPAVVAIAAMVALFPPLVGLGSFQEWIYRALVLLVISCPCALVISIPLGYFGGIGAASRRGILVKGGNVFDALRNITTVAFDKTGTLTQGVFAVSQILPAAGLTEADLMAVAALAESRSNHPIARSILQWQGGPESLPTVGLDIQEISGKGIIAHYQGQRLLVGNATLLRDANIIPSPAPLDNAGSIVHVARDATYLGAIVLHRMGINTVAMLTGDRPEGAAWVATKLDLDVVHASLLPEDKATALESLAPARHTLFVGDGINDAPVLASAGVSVAMGGLGAEAAIEIADVVILDDSPARLVELLHIAARTRAIVWQNIVLALSIKGAFIALGIVGLSGLWEAVFADVGVALLAVLNASRAAQTCQKDN